jgi:LysM repeat protein
MGQRKLFRDLVIVMVLLNCLVFAVLVYQLVRQGWLPTSIVLPGSTPTPPPTAVATATPTLVPTFTSTATPTPTPTPPTPTPTPTNTPVLTPTPTPRTGRVVHTVRPGETLAGIAALYGSPPEDILNLNGLSDPAAIRPGLELIISAPGEVVPTLTPKPTPTPKPPPRPTDTPVPPPTERPKWQYSPAGFYTDWNAGLAQIWGTVRDTAGNPVDGVVIQAKCGSTYVASAPSGQQVGRCCGWYDIVLNFGWDGIHKAQCRWELRVVDAHTAEEGRDPAAAPLSDVAYGEINVEEQSTIIVADWIKNW